MRTAVYVRCGVLTFSQCLNGTILLSCNYLNYISLCFHKVQTISCLRFLVNQGARVRFIACAAHRLVVAPSTYYCTSVAWLMIVHKGVPMNSPRKAVLIFKDHCTFLVHNKLHVKKYLDIIFKK